MLLVNVHQHSAFFDTVNLDGEAVLSEKYSFDENVITQDLQSFRGTVVYGDPSAVIQSFCGEISVDDGKF